MTNHSNQTVTYRARYVFPVVAPPIENGCVEVRGGRVVSVGAWRNQANAKDLGDVAILPALVNAHTHLEFSDLSEPLGQPEMVFTEWIGEVLKQRSSRPPTEEQAARAIGDGANESSEAGVELLGEIATAENIPNGLRQCCGVRFLELIDVGASPERLAQLASTAGDYLRNSALPSGWRAGLSPHAPYTASPALLDIAVRLSQESSAPLAMHLAETRDELQLMRDRSGPFRDLLEKRGVWRPDAILQRPLDYLERLAGSHRGLVVHGNYLDQEEREFLAAQHDKLSLVFCPRTHAFFGHESYPLAELLDAGVHVAIGTDSRASNPDLSLWNELRFIAAHFPGLSPETILKLGTTHGAVALGYTEGYGSIQPGSIAKFAVVEVADSRSPYQYLWDHQAYQLKNR